MFKKKDSRKKKKRGGGKNQCSKAHSSPHNAFLQNSCFVKIHYSGGGAAQVLEREALMDSAHICHGRLSKETPATLDFKKQTT